MSLINSDTVRDTSFIEDNRAQGRAEMKPIFEAEFQPVTINDDDIGYFDQTLAEGSILAPLGTDNPYPIVNIEICEIKKESSTTTTYTPGLQFLFLSNRAGTYDIYLSDLSGTTQTKLSSLTAASMDGMCVSYDNKQVFFTSNHDTASNLQPYVADIAGDGTLSNITRLITDSQNYYGVSLSPNGVDMVITTDAGSGINSIKKYSYNNQTKVLTYVDYLVNTGGLEQIQAYAFSNDGVQVVYNVYNVSVSSINFDGTNQFNYSNANGSAAVTVNWSKYDNRVYYSHTNGVNRTIAYLTDGTDSATANTNTSIVNEPLRPAPHPLGQGFLYDRVVSGSSNIYYANYNGTDADLIISSTNNNITPIWWYSHST